MSTHPNLAKFVIDKIEEDLLNKELFPYGKELWILDKKNLNWFVYIESSGIFWYNQIFFRNYLDLFSMDKREFDRILKKWFEKKIGIPIRQVMKRNSDMNWMIQEMLNKKNKVWSPTSRNGFSYDIVKRFLGIKKEKNQVLMEDFVYL